MRRLFSLSNCGAKTRHHRSWRGRPYGRARAERLVWEALPAGDLAEEISGGVWTFDAAEQIRSRLAG